MLRLSKKNFEDEELPQIPNNKETTKIRNVFTNYVSTDIKLSKAEISEIIQSGGSFSSWLGNSGIKALTNSAIP